MIGREDEVREYRERVKYFYAAIFLAFCLIGSRLVYLQILKGEELRKFSDGNRLKKERLFASRGIIYDRNGKVMVDNRASFDVVLLSQYYNFSHEINERLAKALGIEKLEMERKLGKVAKTPSYYPVLLKADVAKDVIAAVEMDALGFKGVDIEWNVQRRYPYGDISAQLFGYIGEVSPRDLVGDAKNYLQSGDYIGKMGIERFYDGDLRGINGVGYVEVDAMGRRKKTGAEERLLGFVAQTEPIPGNNLYLTLDADLEVAAANALKSRNFNGSVVAMDPRSGEILAMVNYPSYEPQVISGREINAKVWKELREDKDRPLRNRAIQDHYPPGSTYKLFVAIAGLAEGIINPKSTINCNGYLPFGKRRFNCWKRHGPTDFLKAIKESCDVYFYQLGLSLGVDRLAKYARLFGFGNRTGLKLAGEQRGLIPDSEWKLKTFNEPWQAGETLSIAIGQGYVDVTPMQLVLAYAAIGNGGFVYRPYLVRRVEGRNGEIIREYQPELTRKIEVPKEVFDIVKEGLYQVVNEGGTAARSKSSRTVMSGKTGTVQVRAFADISKIKCENLEIKDRHHGWFVGYAPKENPQIAVVAIAEHACHGSSAAPIVKEVIDAYFEKQPAPVPNPGDEKRDLTTANPPGEAVAAKPKPKPVVKPKPKPVVAPPVVEVEPPSDPEVTQPRSVPGAEDASKAEPRGPDEVKSPEEGQ